MEGYIISPLFVYLLEIVDRIGFLFCLVGVFGTGMCAVGMVSNFDYRNDKNSYGDIYRASRKFLPLTIVLFIISMLMPSDETLMYMLVAKYATFENVELTVDALKSTIDYVVETVSTMLG